MLQGSWKKFVIVGKQTRGVGVLTCMPHVLNPDVGAGCEEEPLYWNEEQADDI